MADKKPPESSAELFHCISRLSNGAEWSEAELREALVEAGVDPDVLVRRVLSDVRRYLRQSPFHWRNVAREQRSELLAKIAAAAAQISIDLTREDLLKKVEAARSRLPVPIAAQFALEFRGFQECSREDLVSMLAELELIGGLEKKQNDP